MRNLKEKIKVSVIIPVHNSEEYLKECIESALSQTLEEIEILCIDGGSQDSSPEIIKEMQKRDNRILYIKDANTGYGHKLNVGIDQARGNYISILESDDKMSAKMLETLYHIVTLYDVDMVDSDYYKFFCHEEKEYREIILKYSDSGSYNCLLDGSEREFATHGIWTALYKKEFLKRYSIRLNESNGASYQDTSFLFLTSLLSRNVYHLNVPLYWYRVDNKGSSVKDDKKIFEIIGECNYLKDVLEKKDIFHDSVQKLYYITKYNTFYWNYRRLSLNARKQFLEKYMEELRYDIEKGFIFREMFKGYLYNRTFLLIDNMDEFIKTVVQGDKKSWKERFCDFLDIVKDRSFILFGVGELGSRLMNMLQQNDNCILGICDNSVVLQGKLKNGFTVNSVEQTVKQFTDVTYVIASRRCNEEMRIQLIEYGINEKDIIIFE